MAPRVVPQAYAFWAFAHRYPMKGSGGELKWSSHSPGHDSQLAPRGSCRCLFSQRIKRVHGGSDGLGLPSVNLYGHRALSLAFPWGALAYINGCLLDLNTGKDQKAKVVCKGGRRPRKATELEK